ncbi:MAG: hypothetical protein II306_09300 [Clostridia bacterium]|nr:hypothetical protein [Clostridia bacterium]MEE1025162.1 hypothetical protein [Acutalibacteraceae bacterium]
MDDLTEKITSLLNDPQGMDTIRSLAGQFLSQNSESESKNTDSTPSLSPSQISSMMQLASAFKNNDSDDVRLLLALRPHLSQPRQKKLDRAMTLLKLANILPLLKDSGIGELFGV